MNRATLARVNSNFAQLTAFTHVVATGSFSQAAERLGMTPSAASRAVSRLEQRLGVRLLHRTTRRLGLTDEGTAFHARCLAILADLEEAERSVGRSRSALRGRVKVGAPVAFGDLVLAPAIPEFLQAHPDVALQVSLRDAYIDPIAEGLDVVLRMGAVRSSEFATRTIGQVRLVVAGAPSYFARFGRPQTPHDLGVHACLTHLLRGQPMEWRFVRGRETYAAPVSGRLTASSGEVLRRAALAGLGLVHLFEYTLTADLAARRLEAVLTDHVLPPTSVYVVLPHRGPPPARVRAFVDFVAGVLANSPFRASHR
jgi:LysR family transcriptional regulator, regulator for bpeEF and oprC